MSHFVARVAVKECRAAGLLIRTELRECPQPKWLPATSRLPTSLTLSLIISGHLGTQLEGAATTGGFLHYVLLNFSTGCDLWS